MCRVKASPSSQILDEIHKTTSMMDDQSKAKFLADLAFEIRCLADQKSGK